MKSQQNITNCYYSLRNNPEKCSSHLIHGGSLKNMQLQFVTFYLFILCYFFSRTLSHTVFAPINVCGVVGRESYVVLHVLA